jgi:hypothetical protein
MEISEVNSRASMVKICWLVPMFFFFALLLMALIPSSAAAQAAAEYGGIVGSKSPPRSPEALKNSRRLTEPDSPRASVQKTKKPNPVKAGDKAGKSLIIEKHGARYGQIQ